LNELSLPFALPAGCLYGTRSSANWKTKPGRMDVLNTWITWGRTGKFGIPALEPCDFQPSMLAAWHDPHGRARAAQDAGAIHFFLDDYRFERVWSKPEAALDRVIEVGAALTPDFSIWRDMPLAAQIWQTYRARWVGAYWQYNGIEVIPTVSWGAPETYEFCFEGLPEKSTLAVSSVGVRDGAAKRLFHMGLDELIRQTKPERLLVYGKLGIEDAPVSVSEYPTFWEQRNGR
jgi:hypothetical protein